jgi:membrane-bound ClpP family serine protease
VQAGLPVLPLNKKGRAVNIWLILIIVGVIMLILGVAVEAAKVLLWIGIAVLVISLIMSFVSRGRNRV